MKLGKDILGRLEEMDKYGIGLQIVSHFQPGVRGITSQAKAEATATEINDWIANEIRAKEDRFQAFASLSMYDPKQAGEELRRAVNQLGMKGAMINNFQLGEDGRHIFFDGPEYDVFWSVDTDLDVPLYFHPQMPHEPEFSIWWKDRRALIGPPLQFSNGLSVHILGLIMNGIFDRHPKLQLVIGHLGEHPVNDLWRIGHWLEITVRSHGKLKMERKLEDYFRDNMHITTSGTFNTPLLKFCIDQVGADRIMFFVDYPFDFNEAGCSWLDGLKISKIEVLKIGWENAKKLFKLDTFKDDDNEGKLQSDEFPVLYIYG